MQSAKNKDLDFFAPRGEKTRRRPTINPIPDNPTGHSLFSITTTFFSGNRQKKINRMNDSEKRDFIKI